MLDKINLKILDLLQENARMSASEIAIKVGLSVPAVAERIKKLTESKYIKQYATVLNAREIGYDVVAFIVVDCTSSDLYEHIVHKSSINKNVLECHSITGDGSHLLKMRALNSDELERLLSDIQSWPGVNRTHTMYVLSTYKEKTKLDLNHTKIRKINAEN